MRLGLFLLYAVIACALAIWGCIAVIDIPEQLNTELSGNVFTICLSE